MKARRHESKQRLDNLLVDRGIAEDSKRAAAIILSGVVLVDEQRVDKAGMLIDSASEIRIKRTEQQYVSRAGFKLEAALREFGVQVQGKVCVDLGASTGGFTDCLLQQGAERVYAFDVGRGQLHWDLQQDDRVVVRDSINVRHLTQAMVDDPVDLITVDLAFISLRLIFPCLKQFPSAEIIALVKPQFEARREEVPAGGILHDKELQKEIVGRVKGFAASDGLNLLGEMASALEGRKGNQEYFLYLSVTRT
jgi:23S rRNA (cytidine1920-2'-O)/16S rRNA (cytidine1409-2'-O)-methyltransferase